MGYRKKIVNGNWTRSWIFDIRLFNKRFRKTVKCQKSAVQNLYHKWENEIYSNNGSSIPNLKLYNALDEFLNYIQETKSKTRYKNFKFVISLFKQLFPNMKLNDFKSYHVDEYKIWRSNNIFTNQSKAASNHLINRDIAMLGQFFNYCKERDYYLKSIPTNHKKVKEPVRYVRLTDLNIDEIRTKSNGHLKTALYLILYAGLRRNEICNLKWENIDFNDNKINLPATITKSKKHRFVYVEQILIDFLIKIRNTTDSEYVLTYKGKHVKEFKTAWIRLRNKLSIKILPDEKLLHFHDLRHYFAQRLKDRGLSIADIQTELGHASSKTTEKYYANLCSPDLKEKIQNLEKKDKITL